MDSNIFCENEEKLLDYSKKVYYFDGVEKHKDFFKTGVINLELRNKHLNNSKKKLNEYLFNLLCDITKLNKFDENNKKNFDNKEFDSFLVFSIINKFIYEMNINNEFMILFRIPAKLYFCKEKDSKKIGIKEDKNNSTKLKKFIYDQNEDNSNFLIEKEVTIITGSHLFNIRNVLGRLYTILNLGKKK